MKHLSEPAHGGPPIRLQRALVNGLGMHYASCGDPARPLVMFAHGFPAAWFSWEAQLRAVGRHCFAVAPDLRGTNFSDKPGGICAYQFRHITADLVALAAHLGHARFDLVGQGIGGTVAYAVAAAHPRRLRRLVILNGAHPLVVAREIARNPLQRLASAHIDLFRRSEAASDLLKDGCAYLQRMLRDDADQPPTWLDPVLEARYLVAWTQPGALEGGLNYYRANFGATTRSDREGIHGATSAAQNGRLRAPTLLIWGERDRFLLPGCLQGLGEFLFDLRIERFAQAGHWIAHEMPDTVNRLILEHLVGEQD